MRMVDTDKLLQGLGSEGEVGSCFKGSNRNISSIEKRILVVVER